MVEVKNFDNWIEDKDSGKFGSGASEKIWLVNPKTNKKGLFKFPKIKSDGTIINDKIKVQKSENEMKSDNFVELLNSGNNVWKRDNSKNNGYPIFIWE